MQSLTQLRTLEPLPALLPYTHITAHSGGDGTRANSLSSLEVLAVMGCDFVELDIQPYQGQLFLSHDELSKGPFDAPTLEEAFALLSTYPQLPYLNCDMKKENLVADLYTRAQGFHLQNHIVCTGSLSKKDVAFLQSHFPKGYWQNLYGNGDEIITQGQACNAFALNINHSSLTLDEIRHLVCIGKKLSLWTVDDVPTIELLLKQGVYNITTRNVAAALRLRNHLQSPLV